MRRLWDAVCLFLALAVAPAVAQGAFPAHVFSPYMQVDTGDNLQISSVFTATGQKYYTMAFVIPDGSGSPTWGGTGQSVASGYYSSQINSIRSSGGDVVFSFGGAGGQELALTTTDATTLKNKYEAVVTKYNATWLDFDIEESVHLNTSKNQLRNTALKMLQDAHPGLQITYTLPADTDTGLDSASNALLNDAKSKGLVVHNVNALAMDYGYNLNGRSMSTMATQTATAVHTDVNTVDSTIPIGITIMVGQNDVTAEVFQLSDITPLLNFANANSWVDELGIWSVNRDNGTSRNTTASDLHSGIAQNTWDFTNGFKSFSAVPEPAGVALATGGAIVLLAGWRLNRRNVEPPRE
jgi:chitinase